MITFVTTAGPLDLEKLAGVKWKAPRVECFVRWGTWQGTTIGIEACGKLYAVHVKDESAQKALLSYLNDHSCFGAQVWQEVTGIGVPHIGGCPIPDLVDGVEAVKVDATGKEQKLDPVASKAELEKQHPTEAAIDD